MILKEQIMMAAFNLFSQYGIKNVSMDDIAGSMAISKRTLYGFFDDKESLLTEGLNQIYRKLQSFVLKVDNENNSTIDIVILMYEEFIKSPPVISDKFYDDLKKYPKAVEVRKIERRKIAEIYTRLYNRGVKEGVFMPDINFKIIALLVREQLKMTPLPEAFSKHSCAEVYGTLLITFLRGICTERGRIIVDRWINAKNYNIQ